jgi:hypothetical protein
MESYFDPIHLSPEMHARDQYSPMPSPLPSPRSSTDSMSFDLWQRQYNIHNEAFSELSRSLVGFTHHENTPYLRFALLPLTILALVSRPGSSERALCLDLFETFKNLMAFDSAVPGPIGGAPLDFDIPWDRLDAYSAEIEQQQLDSMVFVGSELQDSAPEWNWWGMLSRIDFEILCKW